MALTITVVADIENQLSSAKQLDSISYNSQFSDSGHSSTLSHSLHHSQCESFTYPGEFLTDDEFTQEFSSSCSSRRCSTDPHSDPTLTFTLPPSDEPDCITIRIPTPPPPPPLPHSSFPPIQKSYNRYLSLDLNSLPSLGPGDTCVVCSAYIFDLDSAHIQRCCSTFLCQSCVIAGLLNNPQSVLPLPCQNPDCTNDPPDDDSRAECIVCYDEVNKTSNKRSCCSQVICKNCIREIVQTNIESEGKSHILCPNPECKKGVIRREEILKYVSGETKEKYERFRLRESGETDKKTCPNCCLITEHKLPRRFKRYKAEDVMITCSMCQFVWCFRCHAPWHQDTTCKQFQKGEKHFKKWTKSRTKKGVANCQKCPLCRVYIQRSTGCDHMTCNRCKAEFCYKCGGFYNGLPGLGNHHTKTSIFGCKYGYKANQPVQRKAIRGGYLGAKLAMLMGYPVLFVAGVAVVVLVGAVALPVYGGYKYYKYNKRTRNLYRRRRFVGGNSGPAHPPRRQVPVVQHENYLQRQVSIQLEDLRIQEEDQRYLSIPSLI